MNTTEIGATTQASREPDLRATTTDTDAASTLESNNTSSDQVARKLAATDKSAVSTYSDLKTIADLDELVSDESLRSSFRRLLTKLEFDRAKSEGQIVSSEISKSGKRLAIEFTRQAAIDGFCKGALYPNRLRIALGAPDRKWAQEAFSNERVIRVGDPHNAAAELESYPNVRDKLLKGTYSLKVVYEVDDTGELDTSPQYGMLLVNHGKLADAVEAQVAAEAPGEAEAAQSSIEDMRSAGHLDNVCSGNVLLVNDEKLDLFRYDKEARQEAIATIIETMPQRSLFTPNRESASPDATSATHEYIPLKYKLPIRASKQWITRNRTATFARPVSQAGKPFTKDEIEAIADSSIWHRTTQDASSNQKLSAGLMDAFAQARESMIQAFEEYNASIAASTDSGDTDDATPTNVNNNPALATDTEDTRRQLHAATPSATIAA